MCDNCTGGLTSLDDGFGQPTYCEKCIVGLDLAMTSVAIRMMNLAEGEAERMVRAQVLPHHRPGGSRFLLALRDENEKLAVCLGTEHDRLEVLYLSLGGHSALAAR